MAPTAKIEEEEALIELVRDRPCLYDKKHPKYFHQIEKSNQWKEIAQHMKGRNVQSTRTLWQSLRNQFSKYQGKLDNPSGTGRSQPPYFRHAGAMGFMKDVMAPKESTTSNVVDEINIDSFENIPLTREESIDVVVVDVDSLPKDVECLGTDDETMEPPTKLNNIGPVSRSRSQEEGRIHSKLIKKRKLDAFDTELLSLMKTEEDEFDIFAKMIAPKLRKLSDLNRVKFLSVQQKINNILIDAEIELLL